MPRSTLRALLLASLCFFAAAPLAHADGTVGAVGANDLRSDGMLLPHASYNGNGDLDLLQSSGSTLYRGRIRLECTDPAHNGTFDFTGVRAGCGGVSYDALIGALARRGVTYLPILINFGTGADGTTRPVPPGDAAAPGAPSRQEFSAFAAAAARRYGPGGTFWARCGCPARPIQAWQVWNEENNGWWWDGTASPTEYAAVVADTRAALRSVDPQARVILGGLTFDANGQSSFVAPEQMIAAVAATNANAFDAVAVHPYTDGRNATGDQLAAAARTYVDQVADAVRRATGPGPDGAPRQQVWITEMGWSDTDAQPDAIAQALSSFVAQLDGGFRSADNVGPVLWYMLRDSAFRQGRDDQLGMRYTGPTGIDSGAKPVWSVFQSAAQSQGQLALPAALPDAPAYVAPPTAPAPPPVTVVPIGAPAAAPPVARSAPVAVKARALRRAVSVTITCTASAARCAGTTLLLAARPSVRARTAQAANMTIGSRSLQLKAGQTLTARIAVRSGLKLGGRRSVRVVVPATDTAGRNVTASTSVLVKL